MTLRMLAGALALALFLPRRPRSATLMPRVMCAGTYCAIVSPPDTHFSIHTYAR
jgi:hypothetical protein